MTATQPTVADHARRFEGAARVLVGGVSARDLAVSFGVSHETVRKTLRRDPRLIATAPLVPVLSREYPRLSPAPRLPSALFPQ